MACYRLFWVRLGYIGLGDCPTGLGNWPRRVRAGARNRREATVKNTKNRTIRCDVTIGTIPAFCIKLSHKVFIGIVIFVGNFNLAYLASKLYIV